MNSPNFQTIGLLYHPKLPQSRVMVAEMLEFVEEFGIQAWVSESWDARIIIPKLDKTDLIVTLGGDGSILRAARMALGHSALILGVNMGRIGFLAEVEPAEWQQCFKQILTESYWTENRMMIQVRLYRDDNLIEKEEALNDVVISRNRPARVVRMATYVNDSYLTTYTADGMILSTPTGSTAYALAAGGPILPPELKNFLLIPVAPHLSLEKALVLAQGDTVKLELQAHYQAVLTIDGQLDFDLQSGDSLEVSVSAKMSRFLRLQDSNYFYKTMLQRLGWQND